MEFINPMCFYTTVTMYLNYNNKNDLYAMWSMASPKPVKSSVEPSREE